MATCRNCFHCRACHEMYLIAVAQEDDFFERHDAETCEDFVNTADVAEVVRCKNCNHQEQCCEFIMISGKDKNIDFCSYGEKRGSI